MLPDITFMIYFLKPSSVSLSEILQFSTAIYNNQKYILAVILGNSLQNQSYSIFVIH